MKRPLGVRTLVSVTCSPHPKLAPLPPSSPTSAQCRPDAGCCSLLQGASSTRSAPSFRGPLSKTGWAHPCSCLPVVGAAQPSRSMANGDVAALFFTRLALSRIYLSPWLPSQACGRRCFSLGEFYCHLPWAPITCACWGGKPWAEAGGRWGQGGLFFFFIAGSSWIFDFGKLKQ